MSDGKPDFEAIQQYQGFVSEDLPELFRRLAQFCEDNAEAWDGADWENVPPIDLVEFSAETEECEPPKFCLRVFGKFKFLKIDDLPAST